MKYRYTIFYVENVVQSIEFYEKAFGLTRIFITPEKDYGELSTGDTKIAFASESLARSNFGSDFVLSSRNKKSFGIELAFTTENIEADLAQAIDNGAMLVQKIENKPWGQKVAYVKDLNGIFIEICTPIEE